MPASFNLADLFEAVADTVPERSAVTAPEGRATYAELDDLADRWAGVLVAAGVSVGDRVAVALPNGLAHLALLLAAFKARAVPVNVNDHYTADELRTVLVDAEPSVVVAAPARHAAVLRALGAAGATGGAAGAEDTAPLSSTVLELTDELARTVLGAAPLPRRSDRSGQDPYLLYTGGTTGVPKGVEWRQEDLFFSALGGDSRPGPPIGDPVDVLEVLSRAASAVLVASPLMHGTAQWVALGSLLAGRHVVVAPSDSLDAPALWDLAETEQVSQLVVVGDAFARPLTAALDAHPGRWSLEALVTVASGGATLSADCVDALFRHLPDIVVVDGYGTTETGGQGRRVLVPGSPVAGPSRFTPTADTGIIGPSGAVLDPACREVGRIARRGRIPLRYRNDPERTAQTFPVIDGERWALTSDLGRFGSDGSIVLVARGERVIHCGGEKVDAQEVEAVVRAFPGVADAMVVGVAESRFGEVVGAVITSAAGASVDLEELDHHCRSCLARFKVPKRWRVVGSLPVTVTGKPDYRRASGWLSRVEG